MTDSFENTDLSWARITSAMEDAEGWTEDFPVDDCPVPVYRLQVADAVRVAEGVRNRAYERGRADQWSWNPISVKPPLDLVIWVWGPELILHSPGIMSTYRSHCEPPELAYYTDDPKYPFVSATEFTGNDRDWFTGVTRWCTMPHPPIPEEETNG